MNYITQAVGRFTLKLIMLWLKNEIPALLVKTVIRSEMTQPPIQIEVKKLGTIFKQRLKKGLEWLSLSERYKPHFYL